MENKGPSTIIHEKGVTSTRIHQEGVISNVTLKNWSKIPENN